MNEKRKFTRLKSPVGVTYKPIKDQKRQSLILSMSRDIAGGGIRIMTQEMLRIGDLLDIEIHIPNLPRPVQAVGEVAWCQDYKGKDGKGREAGILFRDIDAGDLHQILEYVHSIGIG